MPLKIEELLNTRNVQTLFDLEIITDNFVLVKVAFEYEKIKDYYGRYVWRFYDEAEPLTIYFDARKDTYTGEEVLLPRELTFFIDSFSKGFGDFLENSAIGFPTFSLTTVEIMSDGFSIEEKGKLALFYNENSIICKLNSSEPDELIQVGGNIEFYFSKKQLSGIKLELNDNDKILLKQAHLI